MGNDLIPASDAPPAASELSWTDLNLLRDDADAFERSVDYLTEAEVERELSRIAEYRSTNRAAYVKDEETQQRERALLAKREQGPSDLDPELLDEWRRAGGVELHLKIAQEAAETALESLSYSDQQDLVQSFDSLPDAVQTQIFRYISVRPRGTARPASDAVVEKFKEKDVGAAMVKEWGPQAARKLGLIRDATRLMSEKMSASEEQTARDWFDLLPASQQKAVLRALAR